MEIENKNLVGIKLFNTILENIRNGIEEEEYSIIDPASRNLTSRTRNGIKGIVEKLKDLENTTIFSLQPQFTGISKKQKIITQKRWEVHKLTEVSKIITDSGNFYLGYSVNNNNNVEDILFFLALPPEKDGCITPEVKVQILHKKGKVTLEQNQYLENDFDTKKSFSNQLVHYIVRQAYTLGVHFNRKEEKKEERQNNINPLNYLKNLDCQQIKRFLLNWALDDAHKI